MIETTRRPWLRRSMLYPDEYCWYLLCSTLDLLVTNFILDTFRGTEVNQLAAVLVQRFGVPALVLLKFTTVIVVIAVCEIVGRRSARTGLRLARTAIILSALPVGLALLQFAAWIHLGWFQPEIDPARFTE